MTDYQRALLLEIREKSRTLHFRPVKSLYFGGGTPTLLPSQMISAIIQEISLCFSLTGEAERSIEANPGTISRTSMEILLEGGVNRVSLGIQSFDEKNLRRLGRIYGEREIYQALEIIDKLGLNNFSLDLIFGIPQQKTENWIVDIEKAIGTGAPHISAYNLTIEEGTVFHSLIEKGQLKLPAEQIQLDMYLIAKEMLAEAGYRHYEISNFAKPSFFCQHNLTYWDNLEYLGLGAGAHSYIDPIRSANFPDIGRYIEAIQKNNSATAEFERLDELKRMGETLMLGLRCLEGVSCEGFFERFGRRIEEVYPDTIRDLIQKELISYNDRLQLTKRGLIFSNEVFKEFI